MPAALMGTDHYIYRRDGKLYVYQVGGGEPIIFLHANGGSGWFWGKVVADVAHHFACYVVDMPGHDRSDIPMRQYSVEDYADAILDVIDGIGLQQTNIMATRTGGIVAVILAAKYPERVKKMILDSLPYWDKERGEVVWERFFTPRLTDTTSYHLPVAPLTTWEEEKARDPKLGIEEWERRNEILRRSRLWIRMTQEEIVACDVTMYGPQVKASTLLIYGDGDPVRRGQARANGDIKGSSVMVVPDSPLSAGAYLQHPAEVAKLAVGFLSSSK